MVLAAIALAAIIASGIAARAPIATTIGMYFVAITDQAGTVRTTITRMPARTAPPMTHNISARRHMIHLHNSYSNY